LSPMTTLEDGPVLRQAKNVSTSVWHTCCLSEKLERHFSTCYPTFFFHVKALLFVCAIEKSFIKGRFYLAVSFSPVTIPHHPPFLSCMWPPHGKLHDVICNFEGLPKKVRGPVGRGGPDYPEAFLPRREHTAAERSCCPPPSTLFGIGPQALQINR